MLLTKITPASQTHPTMPPVCCTGGLIFVNSLAFHLSFAIIQIKTIF